MPRRAVVVAPFLALLALLAWWGSRGRAPRPTPVDLLLVSIDSLRADHVGCYGYAAAATPALDALAARGLRFEQATTVAPLTLPAHSSLLTGTFPAHHRVRDDGGFILRDEETTLAEVLKERGYRTGGFVSSFALDSRFGIHQGFARYFDDFDPPERVRDAGALQRRGDETVAKALEWLAQEPETPFFAWIHLADPHAPYQAPAPYPSRFPATLAGAYDAEIAWTDSLLAGVLDRLGPRRERTVVVVVGDHGESLGEHGEREHGFFLYDATVQVPLIVAGPGVARRVIPEQVRIVDVMPTVLDLLGAPAPASVQGTSLLPLARGERLDLVALCESWRPRLRYGWSELVAVRNARYKLVQAPRPELYDLRLDGSESRDISREAAPTADAMAATLRSLRASVSAGAAPAQEGELTDPKDRIGTYELLNAAETAAFAGQGEEAAARVRQALAEDPRVQRAHVLLGELEASSGHPAEAVDAYRQALLLDPRDASATFDLAVEYRRLGRVEEAESGFERVHALDPRETRSLWQLADIAIRKGRYDQGEAFLTEGLALKGDRPVLLLKLGECYVEMKRLAEAEGALSEARAARPGLPDLHYQLGRLHEARGAVAQARAEYEDELRRVPGAWRASFSLAKLILKERRPEEAAARFRDAIAGNPGFGEGFVYLAKALLESGDLKGARTAALKGLEIDPGARAAPLGHYVLADVYTRLGRSRDAARESAAARKLERKS